MRQRVISEESEEESVIEMEIIETEEKESYAEVSLLDEESIELEIETIE